MPLLKNWKVQIYENAQLLYHGDAQLVQDQGQNVSKSDRSPFGLSNATSEGLGLGAGTIYQPDAPPDLKVVSWAPSVQFDKVKYYAYDPETSGESIIYVIENGIDGSNRVVSQ